jgi:hypothetical protein
MQGLGARNSIYVSIDGIDRDKKDPLEMPLRPQPEVQI